MENKQEVNLVNKTNKKKKFKGIYYNYKKPGYKIKIVQKV